jgi:hypothetical protein
MILYPRRLKIVLLKRRIRLAQRWKPFSSRIPLSSVI